MRAIDMTDKRFGRWTVLGHESTRRERQRRENGQFAGGAR